MRMQVGGVDSGSRFYLAQLQRSRASDTAVSPVWPVRAVEDAAQPSVNLTAGNSRLLGDRVDFSTYARQLLAQQGAGRFLPYGTALASAETAQQQADASQVRQQAPQEADVLRGVSVLAATRAAAARAGDRPYYAADTRPDQTETAKQSDFTETALQASSASKAEASRQTLSAGVQRYLQMQASMTPQLQTTAVAMNLLA